MSIDWQDQAWRKGLWYSGKVAVAAFWAWASPLPERLEPPCSSQRRGARRLGRPGRTR